MKALEGDTLNVVELGHQLLVASKRFVKGNEVNSDSTRVNEGEGDDAGIDSCKIQTN